MHHKVQKIVAFNLAGALLYLFSLLALHLRYCFSDILLDEQFSIQCSCNVSAAAHLICKYSFCLITVDDGTPNTPTPVPSSE